MSLAEKTEEPEIQIAGVQIDQMMALWPHVKDYFKSFADRSHGEVSAGQLLLQVMKGLRQCWVATNGEEVKACALTEVLKGQLPVVFLGFCAGKDRHEWRDEILDEIERWAQSKEITRIRTASRPGWKKELKDLGWKETHIVMEKEI